MRAFFFFGFLKIRDDRNDSGHEDRHGGPSCSFESASAVGALSLASRPSSQPPSLPVVCRCGCVVDGGPTGTTTSDSASDGGGEALAAPAVAAARLDGPDPDDDEDDDEDEDEEDEDEEEEEEAVVESGAAATLDAFTRPISIADVSGGGEGSPFVVALPEVMGFMFSFLGLSSSVVLLSLTISDHCLYLEYFIDSLVVRLTQMAM